MQVEDEPWWRPSPSGPKVVKRCSLPITSTRRVDLIVTELAVIRPTPDGLVLMETMPGVTVRDVNEASDARLQVVDGLR